MVGLPAYLRPTPRAEGFFPPESPPAGLRSVSPPAAAGYRGVRRRGALGCVCSKRRPRAGRGARYGRSAASSPLGSLRSRVPARKKPTRPIVGTPPTGPGAGGGSGRGGAGPPLCGRGSAPRRGRPHKPREPSRAVLASIGCRRCGPSGVAWAARGGWPRPPPPPARVQAVGGPRANAPLRRPRPPSLCLFV